MTHRRLDLLAGPLQVILSTTPEPLPAAIFRHGLHVGRLHAQVNRNDIDLTGRRFGIVHTAWPR